jgi:hypothetical protein
VTDAVAAHGYDAPDRQRCAVDDLTRIQADDVILESVISGDQDLDAQAIEPDDDDLWRRRSGRSMASGVEPAEDVCGHRRD